MTACLKGECCKLRLLVDKLGKERDQLRAEVSELSSALRLSGSLNKKMLAELENEQQAKYRLIGQVADMTAEIEALRKELVEANSFIESLSKLCQAAEARAIELQSSPQCGRCGKHSVAEIHTCTPTG